MTEQDYLASTSPSDLFAHLEAAGLATEPLCRRFVEACRATWRPDLNWSEDGLVNWRERAAIWCSRSRIHGGIADPKDDAVIAGFIRCIWGNVFRVCSKCKGTGSRERWNHKGNDVSSVQISRCKDCCGKGYPINPDWLTHANGLVPKLARACVTRECELCKPGKMHLEHFDGNSRWTSWKDCSYCHGTGTIPITGPLDPLRLAVLADALEEAGCTSEDILAHLRGQGPHVSGCWVLQLFLDSGKMNGSGDVSLARAQPSPRATL